MSPWLWDMHVDDKYRRFVALLVWYNHGDWTRSQEYWNDVWGSYKGLLNGHFPGVSDDRVTTAAIGRLLPRLEAAWTVKKRRGE
jgi:hypothetical protein